MTAQAPFIEVLYRSHNGKLVGYLKNVLGCCELAREVAQAAFTKLHATYQPEELTDPRAMLFHIARNFALMELRRRCAEYRFMGVAVDVAEAHELPDHRALPYDRQVMTHQIGNRIATAIQEMRPDLRCAFVMLYVEGKARHEIARALGIKEKGVEKRLTKALKALREQLELSGIGKTDFDDLGALVEVVGGILAKGPTSAIVPRSAMRDKRPNTLYEKRTEKSRLAASSGPVAPTEQAARCGEAVPASHAVPAGGGSPALSRRVLLAIQTSGADPTNFSNFNEGLKSAVAAARAGRRVKVITLDRERARWLIRKILSVERVQWPKGLELSGSIRGTSLDSSGDFRYVTSGRRESQNDPRVSASYEHWAGCSVPLATDLEGSAISRQRSVFVESNVTSSLDKLVY